MVKNINDKTQSKKIKKIVFKNKQPVEVHFQKKMRDLWKRFVYDRNNGKYFLPMSIFLRHN